MITIPRTADFQRNYARAMAADKDHCAICGKAITNPGKAAYIRTWYGSEAVTADEAAALQISAPMGDSGCFSIGSDCLRNNPDIRPYATMP